jgi:hypothetical protein
MPDHLHLLLQGETATSDLLRFVQRFKQQTSCHAKQKTGAILWQQRFFDRVLRRDEGLTSVAEYILANPVAAGLVAEDVAYPFCGGELLDAGASEDGAKAASLHPLPERPHDER